MGQYENKCTLGIKIVCNFTGEVYSGVSEDILLGMQNTVCGPPVLLFVIPVLD